MLRPQFKLYVLAICVSIISFLNVVDDHFYHCKTAIKKQLLESVSAIYFLLPIKEYDGTLFILQHF